VRGCRHAPEPLMERLRGAKGDLAAALIRLLADVDPQAALRAAVDVTPQSDPALQRDAVARLEAATFTPEVARTLHHLVGSALEDVRIRALTAMAARGGPRVFAALLHHAEKHAATLTTAEARAAGEALARSSARSALDAFSAWLRPRGAGLLGRLVHAGAPAPLQHAALAGLERIGGEEAGELLALLAEHGPEDVATRARAAHQARGHGSGGGRG